MTKLRVYWSINRVIILHEDRIIIFDILQSHMYVGMVYADNIIVNIRMLNT